MKKIVTVCLLLVLLLGLAACGKSPEEKWQEQYELGMKYVSEGNYEEAVLAFTAALEIDPKKADAYAGLAAAYADQGDWENLDKILKNGLAKTGRKELYDALLAQGGSLSPEEEPDLGILAVFEEMRLQEGTYAIANSLAADFLLSRYEAFPEPVMKLLEPVLEAGYQEDPETLSARLQDEKLWSVLHSVFRGHAYNAQPENEEDAPSLTVWTWWDGAVIQLGCIPCFVSDDMIYYTFSIQYRPESGKGFALDFNPMGSAGERSLNWLSGEVSGYLFNGPFVRKWYGINGEKTAQGTAVNELVDGEYCLKGWNVYSDQYYQYDMGKMLAPWTNDQGEACCIKSVDVDNGYIHYGGAYDWAMEGREGWLMYVFESPWVR